MHQVSFDLLSQTAYNEQKVRTTASNEKFELLLPLYINQEHFERGLPLLMHTARTLCPDMKSYTFKPEMVLSFMPKLLNTMVVLLSGKGISASDRACDGFCSIHRLFIALCDRFNLWKVHGLFYTQFWCFLHHAFLCMRGHILTHTHKHTFIFVSKKNSGHVIFR